MRCGYCGRFMAFDDRGIEWGHEWVCSQQAQHILADPQHWSVDVIALGDDATDIDGDPIYGLVRAELLTPEDLRIVLGLKPVDSDSVQPPGVADAG